MAHPTEARRGPEPPDLSERGGMKNGQPQRADVRLFMQFLAFGGCADAAPLADHLSRAYFQTYGLDVVTTNCSNN